MRRSSPTRKLLTLLSLVVLPWCWGTVFVVTQHLLELPQQITPWQLVAMRFAPAGLLAAGLVLVTRRAQLRALLGGGDSEHPAAPGPYGRWRVPVILIVGVVGVVGYNAALNHGLTRIPGGTAGMVVAMNPLFTAVLAGVAGIERLTGRKVLGIAIAFSGLYVAVRFGSGRELDFRYFSGVLLALLAPLAWALYTVITKPFADRYGSVTTVGVTLGASAVPLLGFWAFTDLPHKALAMPLSGWLAIGYLVVVASVVGILLWVRALEVLRPTQVALCIYQIPFVAIITDRVLGREQITWPLGLGAVILVGGVALAGTGREPGPAQAGARERPQGKVE